MSAEGTPQIDRSILARMLVRIADWAIRFPRLTLAIGVHKYSINPMVAAMLGVMEALVPEADAAVFEKRARRRESFRIDAGERERRSRRSPTNPRHEMRRQCRSTDTAGDIR